MNNLGLVLNSSFEDATVATRSESDDKTQRDQWPWALGLWFLAFGSNLALRLSSLVRLYAQTPAMNNLGLVLNSSFEDATVATRRGPGSIHESDKVREMDQSDKDWTRTTSVLDRPSKLESSDIAAVAASAADDFDAAGVAAAVGGPWEGEETETETETEESFSSFSSFPSFSSPEATCEGPLRHDFEFCNLEDRSTNALGTTAMIVEVALALSGTVVFNQEVPPETSLAKLCDLVAETIQVPARFISHFEEKEVATIQFVDDAQFVDDTQQLIDRARLVCIVKPTTLVHFYVKHVGWTVDIEGTNKAFDSNLNMNFVLAYYSSLVGVGARFDNGPPECLWTGMCCQTSSGQESLSGTAFPAVSFKTYAGAAYERTAALGLFGAVMHVVFDRDSDVEKFIVAESLNDVKRLDAVFVRYEDIRHNPDFPIWLRRTAFPLEEDFEEDSEDSEDFEDLKGAELYEDQERDTAEDTAEDTVEDTVEEGEE